MSGLVLNCVVEVIQHKSAESSLSRMPALGVGGGVRCFLSDCPRKNVSFLVYKASVLAYTTRASSFE